MSGIKNFNKAEVVTLKEQVAYQEGYAVYGQEQFKMLLVVIF